MRAITIHQPYASLIACGAKRLETRSWRTNYRGRIAIHAAASDETWEEIWRDAHERPGTAAQVVDAVRRANPWWTGAGWYADHHAVLADSWFTDACDEPPALLPLGAVVATAELVDCVPIVGSTEPPTPDDLIFRTTDGRNLFRQQTVGDPWTETGVRFTELTDQLPFGVFEPGRWAWLLDDIKPVNERCPWCWGARFACPLHGRLAICECPTVPLCRRCDGRGSCDPIPARGKQGLWELEL